MCSKKALIQTIVLIGLSLTACVAQQKDNIFLEGAPGQSYGERYQPARAALSSGNFEELKMIMGLNPTVVREAPNTCAIPESTDKTDTKVDEKRTSAESKTKTTDENALAKTENSDKEYEVLLTDEETKAHLVANNSELSIIERGLLTLNTGDYQRALLYFDAAEQRMEATDAQTKAATNANKFGKGAFAALTGMEESKDYYLRGYEKVMLYNYKALCYMLLGDRKAYNVTRKAIDKQQEEWKFFQDQLEELEKRNKTNEESENSDEDTSSAIAKYDSRDEYTKEKAILVPNAYVNPFGDYMNAVILEIDSYDEKSLRDNARIAYKKVLDNNKDCTTAKQAMSDMRKNAPRNTKLVHVLLADGFSPELVQKTVQFSINDVTATANYTEATPHPSDVTVARIKIGKVSRTMSSLSKMESIILRDDLDKKPFKNFWIAMAFARTAAVEIIGNETGLGLLGKIGSAVMTKVQRPDTRSWLSLPNQIMVARVYVPNNAKTLSISTYNEKKKEISSTNVALAKTGPSVVYAVNYGTHLHAMVNESSWITK